MVQIYFYVAFRYIQFIKVITINMHIISVTNIGIIHANLLKDQFQKNVVHVQCKQYIIIILYYGENGLLILVFQLTDWYYSPFFNIWFLGFVGFFFKDSSTCLMNCFIICECCIIIFQLLVQLTIYLLIYLVLIVLWSFAWCNFAP